MDYGRLDGMPIQYLDQSHINFFGDYLKIILYIIKFEFYLFILIILINFNNYIFPNFNIFKLSISF